MFNLDDDEEDGGDGLTHMGQSLFDERSFGRDDFQEDDLPGLEDDDGNNDETVGSKKRRKRHMHEVDGMADGDSDGGESSDSQPSPEGKPERKKSKQEVMKEVIAKSKFHKYERQQAKEDDVDIRTGLDKEGLPQVFEAMRTMRMANPSLTQKPESKSETETDVSKTTPSEQAGPAAPSGGTTDKEAVDADREYDLRLRQLTYDKRSQPADRTKTAEEKATEEAERLKELETERSRRMRGEDDEDEDEDAGHSGAGGADGKEDESEDEIPDDAKAFGLPSLGVAAEGDGNDRSGMGVEDEDDFLIEDIVDSDSEAEPALSDIEMSDDSGSGSESGDEAEADDGDDLVGDLALPPGASKQQPTASGNSPSLNANLAYTYPCPSTHAEFLNVVKDLEVTQHPVVVQRIRALYHPRLAAENKSKLAKFSQILVQHVVYLVDAQDQDNTRRPPFSVVENLLRHVHSLAKQFPEGVAASFRDQLRQISHHRPLALRPSDLVVLTGIAAIFPTSDHFHAVVTPSVLCMCRYLEQGSIASIGEMATGVYVVSLCLQYQSLSKRYIPEVVNYLLSALLALAPAKAKKEELGTFFLREPSVDLRLKMTNGNNDSDGKKNNSITNGSSKKGAKGPSATNNTNTPDSRNPTKLQFWDVLETGEGTVELKLSLISTIATLLRWAGDSWADKSAFIEIFTPVRNVIKFMLAALSKTHTSSSSLLTPVTTSLETTLTTITTTLKTAKRTRRPLLLHNHRPLAIKSAIPKFEETFNPDKHYDPDRERAEMNKLRAEHRRERKGALRELRKDANFVAREQLRDKRERDAAYEKKYRRLVSEVQTEEGRAANEYEREKKKRLGKY